jgi:hypothetical protein
MPRDTPIGAVLGRYIGRLEQVAQVITPTTTPFSTTGPPATLARSSSKAAS